MKHILKQSTCILALVIGSNIVQAQPDRWQQRAEYVMDVKMDVSTHQFIGTQKLTYFNNSPDTLTKVFYHLYFNAFQPNSQMDVRSRTISDPDRRVGSRIAALKPDEIGQQNVTKLTQNGKAVKFETVGTILEVSLDKPILPKSKVVFDMEFNGQVPLQVRRSGRNSSEGIAYSMTQWYPKMSEYDYQGWHANPYIGREFYGIWGDFDVKITMDSTFLIGGTGVLQNPEQIGHGYQKPGQAIKRPNSPNLTWHFKAQNVHDFAFAADPDYVHYTRQVPNGPLLHIIYQPEEATDKVWPQLGDVTVKLIEYMSKHFGQYPYPQYTVIQGGDGGMEYAMATLVTGKRSWGSLVGVTAHELAHSWYQQILGTNESLYGWMDEGYTEYSSSLAYNYAMNETGYPHAGSYSGYLALAKSGKEEPMSTHADHFITNYAYSLASYSKGAVSLAQLGYIIGDDNLKKGMLNYYNTWKFKHPNDNDFKRIMEKQSGLELDWYYEYFKNTTNTIDYGIKSVISKGDQTEVTLERIGKMPMPIELVVAYADGSKETFYMPLEIMRGAKANENKDTKWTLLTDWPWTHPTYKLSVPKKSSEIVSLEIDPSKRMADIERNNNSVSFE